MTLLGAHARVNPSDVNAVSFYVTDLMLPSVTFTTIIACTTITGIQLHQIGKTRKSMTSDKNISNKEKKVAVMLVVVSAIFIACLAPTIVKLTGVAFVTELSVFGDYFDVAMVINEISCLSETLSSSVNLLVYYKMSSKYRRTVKSISNVKNKTPNVKYN
ncbi:uncharacterized protein LOC131932327 [Physella acuta]|uniref:uncharacterized protein LOC131932327 n=1 Tax=Physella acuta TaxID=109671 RepID=UPI0027DBD931|nr:uncharacterized protein LOC131932327 [Physella acuta]